MEKIIINKHVKDLIQDKSFDHTRFLHKKTGHLVEFEAYGMIKQQSGDVTAVFYRSLPNSDLRYARPITEWNSSFIQLDLIILEHEDYDLEYVDSE